MGTTVGERLVLARHEAGFPSIRAFQQALPPEVRGGGYASVYSYVKEGVEPPLEFLVAASKLLGVRLEWLRDGRGPMVEGDAPEEWYREQGRSWEAGKRAEVDAIDRLLGEGVERAGSFPPVARRMMLAFLQDLYQRKGPAAFGVEPGKLTAARVKSVVRELFPFSNPRGTYAERMAGFLGQLSAAYVQTLGSNNNEED